MVSFVFLLTSRARSALPRHTRISKRKKKKKKKKKKKPTLKKQNFTQNPKKKGRYYYFKNAKFVPNLLTLPTCPMRRPWDEHVHLVKIFITHTFLVTDTLISIMSFWPTCHFGKIYRVGKTAITS